MREFGRVGNPGKRRLQESQLFHPILLTPTRWSFEGRVIDTPLRLRIPHFSSVRKRIAIEKDRCDADADVDAPSLFAEQLPTQSMPRQYADASRSDQRCCNTQESFADRSTGANPGHEAGQGKDQQQGRQTVARACQRVLEANAVAM